MLYDTMKHIGKQGKLKVTVSTHNCGLEWLFQNDKKETLSVICHNGSYGAKNGLFEIMPSWRKPQRDDAVEGWLTFGEVQEWISELESRTSEQEVKRVESKPFVISEDNPDADYYNPQSWN